MGKYLEEARKRDGVSIVKKNFRARDKHDIGHGARSGVGAAGEFGGLYIGL